MGHTNLDPDGTSRERERKEKEKEKKKEKDRVLKFGYQLPNMSFAAFTR